MFFDTRRTIYICFILLPKMINVTNCVQSESLFNMYGSFVAYYDTELIVPAVTYFAKSTTDCRMIGNVTGQVVVSTGKLPNGTVDCRIASLSLFPSHLGPKLGIDTFYIGIPLVTVASTVIATSSNSNVSSSTLPFSTSTSSFSQNISTTSSELPQTFASSSPSATLSAPATTASSENITTPLLSADSIQNTSAQTTTATGAANITSSILSTVLTSFSPAQTSSTTPIANITKQISGILTSSSLTQPSTTYDTLNETQPSTTYDTLNETTTATSTNTTMTALVNATAIGTTSSTLPMVSKTTPSSSTISQANATSQITTTAKPISCSIAPPTPPWTSSLKTACPSPYTLLTGFGCYLPGSINTTWSIARNNCILNGGDLVTFQNFTPTQLLYVGDCLWYYSNFHVGFTGVLSTYTWVTGEVLLATNVLWARFYPASTLAASCGRTTTITTYEFSDVACTATLAFVCEIKVYY